VLYKSLESLESLEGLSSEWLRCNVTYVSQLGEMFEKGVLENVSYGCGVERLTVGNGEVSELYEGLKEGSRSMLSLSGGERQTLNVISGLMQRSKVLILDEPTTGLDAKLKSDLLRILREYKEKKECMIIISHDADVFPLFDETIMLGKT